MSDILGRVVKAQRIEFIVKYMIAAQLESDQRCLLDEWLGELTEDLLTDLKGYEKAKAPLDEGLSN